MVLTKHKHRERVYLGVVFLVLLQQIHAQFRQVDQIFELLGGRNFVGTSQIVCVEENIKVMFYFKLW